MFPTRLRLVVHSIGGQGKVFDLRIDHRHHPLLQLSYAPNTYQDCYFLPGYYPYLKGTENSLCPD